MIDVEMEGKRGKFNASISEPISPTASWSGERDRRKLDVTTNSLANRRRNAHEKEKEQRNLPPAKNMRRSLAQDPIPRPAAGYDYDDREANAAYGGGWISDERSCALDDQCNTPSHGGPSYQSSITDHSHHETSYGTFNNCGYHVSGRGTITVNAQTNCQSCSSNPLKDLEYHCSPGAVFDSAARFDPPRCAESTRLGIIRIIEKWIDSDGNEAVPSSFFWLHGGAGVGKSAVAQSLSEKFQEKQQLAASFFFFRGDPSRNNGDHLIPTLVSQLVDAFEGIAPFVKDRIRENRSLFTKRYEVQIRELLIEPFLALKSKGAPVTHPRLVVIDGLDECQNPEVQCELLRVIARAIPRIPYPIRFLVASRPEAHITDVFNHDRALQAITIHRYNLSDDPDADMEIRKFLEEKFEEIRRVHRLGPHLPHDWPDQKAITSLVERSSKHFIYASTVISYIQSRTHRPDDRLEVILRLRPPQEGDRPYAQLDAVYRLIFEGVESPSQLEKICLVLGILYFREESVGIFQNPPYPSIADVLEMRAGDLDLLLDPILSLVAMDCHDVRILHKSLLDYLLDFTRGGHLPFDLAQVHKVAATYLLSRKTVVHVYTLPDLQDFLYHCQYAPLNNNLKYYLYKASPKSVATIIKAFPLLDNGLNRFLLPIMWHFFRTISRKDVDSTGQYVAKLMDDLHSAVQTHTQPQTKDGWKFFSTKVDGLKHELDTLLMEWKPQKLNFIDIGIDSIRHLAMVTQEHSILSAYAEVAFPGNRDMIASSLVLGDYFIHSYNFRIQHKNPFLILRTYARHSGACHQYVMSKGLDIVSNTQMYLSMIEKDFFSDFYQKYGVKMDVFVRE